MIKNTIFSATIRDTRLDRPRTLAVIGTSYVDAVTNIELYYEKVLGVQEDDIAEVILTLELYVPIDETDGSIEVAIKKHGRYGVADITDPDAPLHQLRGV